MPYDTTQSPQGDTRVSSLNDYHSQPATLSRHYPEHTLDDELLHENHMKILKDLKDKALIISVLCCKSNTLFSRMRIFINIPLILSSGAMTILNSMNDTNSDGIKYANIVLNSCTVTILSLIGNFKLAERELTYRQTHIRMKKLYHQIENKVRLDPYKITTDYVGNMTKEYINIYEHLEYPIPNFVIQRFNKDITTDREKRDIRNDRNDRDNLDLRNDRNTRFRGHLTFAQNLDNNKNLTQFLV